MSTRYHRIRALTYSHCLTNLYHLNFWEARFYTGLNQTGTEFATLGTAFANDIYQAGMEANKANDNNSLTCFASGTSAIFRHWGIDSGAGNAYDLKSIAIQPWAEAAGVYLPQALIVEESADNSNWVAISDIIITTNTTTNKTWYYFNVIKTSTVYNQIIPAMTIY